MIRRAMRARELPSAAISASCVGRTLMIANSAATKNPFAMMNSKARSKYQPGMLTEREGPSRYEMEGRPWKGGIVSIVSAPPPPRLRVNPSPCEFIQRSPEARIRLRHHLLVCNRDVAARESGDGEGHRDAVIVVRFDRDGVG